MVSLVRAVDEAGVVSGGPGGAAPAGTTCAVELSTLCIGKYQGMLVQSFHTAPLALAFHWSLVSLKLRVAKVPL